MINFQWVPTAGTVLVLERVESQNYDPGTAGWAIFAAGDAEFANLLARGTLIGGQVVINGTAYPNAIAFYTDNPSEVEPAVIRPSGAVGNVGVLRLQSPVLFAGGTPGTMELEGYEDGHSAWALDVDNARLTAADAATFEAGNGMRFSADFTNYLRIVDGSVRWEGEVWRNLTYAGNWATSGGLAVQYFRDAAGRVQLRGRATEPVALSAVIGTLPGPTASDPIGYRPSRNMSFAVKANNDAGTVCWIEVQTDGDIQVIGNAAAARVQTVLDAISFPTF